MAAKKRLSTAIRQQLEAAFLEALRRHNESRGSGVYRKKKAPARKKKAGTPALRLESQGSRTHLGKL